MAELPDSEPLENVRNDPCPEHSTSGGKPVEHDAGRGVTSPSEVQVSLLIAGDSSPVPARLSLTSRNIVFEVTGNSKKFTRVELLLLDLLGALVLPKDDGSCALQVHTFAYSKMTRHGLVPAPGRTHEVFTVSFTGEAPADSRATAEQWKASLLQRCSQRCRDIFVYEPPLHQRQRGERVASSANWFVCK